MRAVGLLIAALLAAPAAAEEPLDRLRDAWKSGDEVELAGALDAARGLNDRAAVSLIARALDHKSPAVRSVAIDALGFNPHPDALRALHSRYWNDKAIREDEVAFSQLLRSIGRHGDASSVKVLSDSPFDHLTIASGRARILGLANIRTREALEALIEGSRKAGGISGRRGGVESEWTGKFRSHFRAALFILTGQDLGHGKQTWSDWWNENKGSFRVAADRPAAPADVVGLWEEFWGTPYDPASKPAPARPSGSPYERVEKPTPEQVREGVAALVEAFSKGDETARREAIESYGGIESADIVRAVSQGLQDRSKAVRLTAIDALGWCRHPDALKQLHRFYRRETGITKAEDLHERTLRAIGRHGSVSSLDVLTGDIFKNLTLASGRARILGLGNIRSTRAIDELIQATRLAGGERTRRGSTADQPYMPYFRLALAVLTGADEGLSKEAWEGWWREHKRSFRMSPKRPEIAPDLQRQWEAYWGEPY